MTESVQGIDVSRLQPVLTPTALKGFAFAFAKATDGPELTDSNFAGNWSTGAEVLAFCQAVQAGAGPQCPVLVYSDLSVLPPLGQCTGYPLWVTWPSSTAPASVAPWSTWTLWQWGQVSNTDQDAFNGTAAAMDAWIKTYTDPAEVSLSLTMPMLQVGDADYAGASFSVHRLQALIAVIGGINNLAAASAVSADGNFGPETQAGLKAVQQFYKIPVSGIADKDTWDVLLAGTP